MGDHSSETLKQLKNRQTDEKHCCNLLGRRFLNLDRGSTVWILKHIDYFGSQSRINQSIESVNICLHAFYGRDDDDWDKLGQAIGNLQSLEKLFITTPGYTHAVITFPDWEIRALARILSHVRQKITLTVECHYTKWLAEKSRSFARAIQGHPTITRFEDGKSFPYEALDSIYSALATLPALES
jgi:hypothetical protein